MKLSLVFALAACSASTEHRLSFPDASPAAFATAAEAAAEWNACPDVTLTLTRGYGDVEVRLVPPEALGPHAGLAAHRPPRVHIDARFETHRPLYAHEFGHVLGREHGAVGVMRADVPDDAHVTPGDCP